MDRFPIIFANDVVIQPGEYFETKGISYVLLDDASDTNYYIRDYRGIERPLPKDSIKGIEAKKISEKDFGLHEEIYKMYFLNECDGTFLEADPSQSVGVKSKKWIRLHDGRICKVLVTPSIDRQKRLILRTLDGNRLLFEEASDVVQGLDDLWLDAIYDGQCDSLAKKPAYESKPYREFHVIHKDGEYTKDSFYKVDCKALNIERQFLEPPGGNMWTSTYRTKRSPERSSGGRSRYIPEDVKHEVWERDGGKCVVCGSSEDLEFDHDIPFSKGGSSSARNLRLLCRKCNRSKSDKI